EDDVLRNVQGEQKRRDQRGQSQKIVLFHENLRRSPMGPSHLSTPLPPQYRAQVRIEETKRSSPATSRYSIGKLNAASDRHDGADLAQAVGASLGRHGVLHLVKSDKT